MITLMPVLGTRPEVIKLAPLILQAKAMPDIYRVKVCVTGQHSEMLKQMLTVFDIVPDIDLALMRPNQSLAEFCSRSIDEISKVLELEQPRCVIVQGDTTTVWTAAIAAFY